jgi:hypothetical protein
MPYTTPLADLPSTWPTTQAPLVDDNKRAARELATLLQQLRVYLRTVDDALRQVEPP